MSEFVQKFRELCKSSLRQLQIGNACVVTERFDRLTPHAFTVDEAKDVREFYRILKMDQEYARKQWSARCQQLRSEGLEHDVSIIESDGARHDHPPDEEANRMYDFYMSYFHLFDIARIYLHKCGKP